MVNCRKFVGEREIVFLPLRVAAGAFLIQWDSRRLNRNPLQFISFCAGKTGGKGFSLNLGETRRPTVYTGSIYSKSASPGSKPRKKEEELFFSPHLRSGHDLTQAAFAKAGDQRKGGKERRK